MKTPFKKMFYVRKELDIKAMNSACNYLLGKKDFTSFSKLKTQTPQIIVIYFMQIVKAK